MSDVTVILHRVESGDCDAARELIPLVYAELRRLAASELGNEASGNTLQPTALVHEAYVRLVDQSVPPEWSHRGHFYAAAAEAMRRILVESARRKRTVKRGGGLNRVDLNSYFDSVASADSDLLSLNDALDDLAERRPEVARLVSLRYFAGLTMDQAALALGISPRTAARQWVYAKATLLESIRG